MRRALGDSYGRGHTPPVISAPPVRLGPVRLNSRRSVLLLLLSTVLLLGGVPAPASAETTISVAGHGFGHGRGLSQWGAYGYAADYGWSYQQILDHYYGGTTPGSVANTPITVRLMAMDGVNEIVVSSAAEFYLAGTVRVPAGTAAHLVRTTGGWAYTPRPGGCSGTDDAPSGLVLAEPNATLSYDAGDTVANMLTLCNTGTTYRGALNIATIGGSTRVVNVVPIESYLRGVVTKESLASWGSNGGMAALQAQAVAARSYALTENRQTWAQTCDTTACQVYGGASKNGVAVETGNGNYAVSSTAGEVRLDGQGRVVLTEFSSSSGGWTAGGAFPAVEDLGDTRSPNHDWTTTITGTQISQAWPSIGTFRAATVLTRNGLGADGGRVLTIEVRGTAGTVTLTGNQFRSGLKLLSDWYTLRVTGVDPYGPDTFWEARYTSTGGRPDASFGYGGPGAQTLSCDINNDGQPDAVAYQQGNWYIRFSMNSGPPDLAFQYGGPGMLPVCGNWDGVGGAGIGVYSGGEWSLKNTASAGYPDYRFQYGWSAARPVVGDWDGNGTETIGIFDPALGRWQVRNSNSAGAPASTVDFGWSAATPVPGDWDGNGRTDIGVFADGIWYLRQSFSGGAPERYVYYGAKTDQPFVVSGRTRTPRGIGVSRDAIL